jgi:hypothetical protein
MYQESDYTLTFNASSENSPEVYFSIVSLPKLVNILLSDGTPISSNASHPLGNVTLVGKSGAYGNDSFSWYAVDGKQITSSVVTISFNVIHVNHAPNATGGVYLANSANYSQLIKLNGYDSDGDALTYWIASESIGDGQLQACDDINCATGVTADVGSQVPSGFVRFVSATTCWQTASFTFYVKDTSNATSSILKYLYLLICLLL